MAKEIYGPSVPHMQGKTMHQEVKHSKLVEVQKLLQDIIGKYKSVILCCDIMHINGLDFLNTVSQENLFGIISLIKNLNIDTIDAAIKQVNTLYLQWGL